MSIYHSAFLFNTEDFLKKISPYLDASQSSMIYDLLRAEAINLFDNNAGVRKFFANYGGWDKNQITAISQNTPHTQQDIAFWLISFLYDEIGDWSLTQMGLGQEIELLNDMLGSFGWSQIERYLLIKGKTFMQLAQLRLGRNDEYWNYFHPLSQSGWAGWLDSQNIKELLVRLLEDEHKLKDENDLARRVYEAAKHMLHIAQEAKSDLCILISG